MCVLLYQHTRDDSDSMVIVLILSFIHHADITLEVITLNEGPNVPTWVTTKLPKQHNPGENNCGIQSSG